MVTNKYCDRELGFAINDSSSNSHLGYSSAGKIVSCGAKVFLKYGVPKDPKNPFESCIFVYQNVLNFQRS